MTHTNVGPGTWAAFVAVLLCTAAPLCAAPAAADSTDDAFVAALVSQGIPVPDGNAAVQEGRKMCALLDQGTTRPLLLMQLMRDTNLSARQAGFFLGISTSAYCPQYKTITG
ncbi:DUF732 domain-containing protein [Mycobacterium sp. 852002-51057_SCH5723018]|uniref:DUF732 domain-containing protein n=1 Tax=Mycobacterium sp. 852002-51057_SCH5723018 TaxID=1834094 RepID=UPI0007FF7FBF|nr:DUF732 domain-containing protein [Mycobacterium sp. 852002-51057_SCH5723018]OBG30512.1 hypothetical protein A5764_00230 [Mycobacterium sp. 852002-51057_SCH5723018]